MTIYADVLVALNILITYILLVATRVVCKFSTNKWAVMIASVIGGFTAVIIFFEDLGTAFSVLYKILTGAVIVGVAFLPKNFKLFFKLFLCFFLVSFLFGGAMYAVHLMFNPRNILYFNGTVYFDMSLSYLVGCVLSIYGVVLIADYLLSKRSFKSEITTLEITFNNTSVTIPALLDTGNSLVEGLSGRPVIVAEFSAVAPLFTRAELLFFKNQDYENIPESLLSKFRLVHCKSVTGESLLPSFNPKMVKIVTPEDVVKTDFCTVAVVNKNLSQGEYNAILNNNIFQNAKEEKNNEKVFV